MIRLNVLKRAALLLLALLTICASALADEDEGPTVRAVQTSETTADVSWSEVRGADSYTVKMYRCTAAKRPIGDPIETRTTDRTRLTFSGLDNTKVYAFSVTPIENGKPGTPSKRRSMVMAKLWAESPKIAAAEVDPDVPWVTLTVTYRSAPDSFIVYDKRTEITSQTELLSITETEATLRIKTTNGEHSFVVRPYKNGEKGEKSRGCAVEVAVQWMTERFPIGAAIQVDRDAKGGTVYLSWDWLYPEAEFLLYEIIDRKPVLLTNVTREGMMAELYARGGRHTYGIAACRVINGETYTSKIFKFRTLRVREAR